MHLNNLPFYQIGFLSAGQTYFPTPVYFDVPLHNIILEMLVL